MAIGFSAALAAKFGLAAVMVGAGTARAAEIKVISSVAVKEAYLELVPAFERASGHKVTLIWSGTVDIMKRIGGGEVVDLVIVAGPTIDALTQQGRIVPGALPLARSGIGVAVKAGAPKPDISSGDALKRSLLAAKSVADLVTWSDGLYQPPGKFRSW